jgi:hypothetical protein
MPVYNKQCPTARVRCHQNRKYDWPLRKSYIAFWTNHLAMSRKQCIPHLSAMQWTCRREAIYAASHDLYTVTYMFDSRLGSATKPVMVAFSRIVATDHRLRNLHKRIKQQKHECAQLLYVWLASRLRPDMCLRSTTAPLQQRKKTIETHHGNNSVPDTAHTFKTNHQAWCGGSETAFLSAQSAWAKQCVSKALIKNMAARTRCTPKGHFRKVVIMLLFYDCIIFQ